MSATPATSPLRSTSPHEPSRQTSAVWRRDWSRGGSGSRSPIPFGRGRPGAAGGWPGAGSGQGGSGGPGRAAGLFAFVRAWAAGIVVLMVTEYLQITLVYETFTGPRGPRSFTAAMLLVHLPNLVCVALTAWAAGRMHPEPQSDAPVRHVMAVCAVPVCAQLVALSALWHRPGFDALGLWLSNGVLLAGCAIGWAADRWQRAAAG